MKYRCSENRSGVSYFSFRYARSVTVVRLCPRERVIFTCRIPSVGHQWEIPSLAITRTLLPRDQGRVISEPQFQFTVTEVMTGTLIITSTATVTANVDLNGTLVVCRDGIGMLLDQITTIIFIGENGACTVVCLYID